MFDQPLAVIASRWRSSSSSTMLDQPLAVNIALDSATGEISSEKAVVAAVVVVEAVVVVVAAVVVVVRSGGGSKAAT